MYEYLAVRTLLPRPGAHPPDRPAFLGPPKSVVSPSRLLSLSTKQVTPLGRSFQFTPSFDDTDSLQRFSKPIGSKKSDAVGLCSDILRNPIFHQQRRLSVEPLVSRPATRRRIQVVRLFPDQSRPFESKKNNSHNRHTRANGHQISSLLLLPESRLFSLFFDKLPGGASLLLIFSARFESIFKP